MMAKMSADSGDAGERADVRRHDVIEARDVTLARLHREQYPALVRLACLLIDHQEVAEEIVQEAFERLHRRWPAVDDPTKLPAYLRSTVLNLARSSLRHRRVVRRSPLERRADDSPADHAALLHDDQREVIEALRTLPRRQREVLVLRYWQHMSEREIADALGVAPGSVKTHTHRAMAAMATKLEGRR